MEKDTYLILRVTAGGGAAYDPLSTYDWRSARSAESAPALEYQVGAQTLDQQDYREARNDRQVAAIARPMPLRLIEPVAAPEPSAAPAPIHGATWGVFVTGALQSPYVGHGVTAAVLDTGIDAGHEAFHGVELIQKDFTGEGDGDENGHGTHVAGTIFGQAVQGLRYGVAPGVRRALIGKVLGTQRSATTQELVDAIQWAVDQGAHVINMSLGFDFPGLVQWWTEERSMPVDLATSQALAQYRDNVRLFDRLVELLRARAAHREDPLPGGLIIAAAGNESKRHVRPDYAIEVLPPAAADGVVAVAALQSAGPPHDALTVAPFSNIGAVVAGPGVGVYSARKGGGYTYLDGTSMASPHVTGVAALWAERQLQRRGTVDISALDAQLRGNARRDRLPAADYLDVGEGLATAPLD
jgi:subtilisin family serine protease